MAAKFRITWKKQPSEQGLARVCQDERGKVISVNGQEVGGAFPLYKGLGKEKIGYYWCARKEEIGITGNNSTIHGKPFETIDEAVAACDTHVRTCLGLKVKS